MGGNANLERKEQLGRDSEGRAEIEATDKSRLVELLQAIHEIGKLRREAANAQVDARQLMRKVGFKRQSVWMCDAAFMREVQRLTAEEPLEKFAGLRRLAADCQAARDGLGPLEQEGVEAEQRWEGHNWMLRQTEEGLYDEFKSDFEVADAYSPQHFGVPSSQYNSYSDTESNVDADVSGTGEDLAFRPTDSMASLPSFEARPQTITIHATSDYPTSEFLLGLTSLPPEDEYIPEWDSDSGIGEIDNPPDDRSCNDLVGSAQRLPPRQDAVTERYPELSSHFGTRRARINKWLLQTMLVSHFEADLLVAQLDSETGALPSNWSQLVIAYWELDDASVPVHQNSLASQIANSPLNSNSRPEASNHESPKLSSSSMDTAHLLHDSSYQDGLPKRTAVASKIPRPRAAIGMKHATI